MNPLIDQPARIVRILSATALISLAVASCVTAPTSPLGAADARARLTELVAEAAKPPPPPRKKTRPTKGSVERRLKSKAGRSTVKKLRGKVGDD